MLGIIGAMPEEIQLIKEELQDVQTHTIGDIEFHQGKINNQELILCRSGIGKVNSAYASTILIYVFKVKGLLFTGVAGGVKKELNIGDIVIGTDFKYHDVDATPLGNPMYVLPDGYLSHFIADTKLSECVYNISIESFGQEKISKGTIISGDQFIASADKIQEFQEALNASAVDMESAAVAHIANKSGIPCCIIRSISDKADGDAHFVYQDFVIEVAKKSAHIVVELFNNYTLSDLI